MKVKRFMFNLSTPFYVMM